MSKPVVAPTVLLPGEIAELMEGFVTAVKLCVIDGGRGGVEAGGEGATTSACLKTCTIWA